ncbi:hypothetical protein BDV98DRAFT_592312 [Pterulicium gracile]|uniref:Uncharacterized protein n=1 Tax=Pterulicium gracile TaxID=1884261 RepID=A0A5C3QQ48_9AGAR|nr:hypothetical protein BDV98DRAFT_592312 [Pterula gracilis]
MAQPRQVGAPRGYMGTFNGTTTYMVLPKGAPPKASVIFLHSYESSGLSSAERLFVDRFADAGFWALAPQFSHGDSQYLDGNRMSLILNVVNYLRNGAGDATAPIAVYTIQLAQSNTVQVALATYPRQLIGPAKFQALLSTFAAPFQLHNAALNTAFTPA